MNFFSFPKTLVSISLTRWAWFNLEIKEKLRKRLSRDQYHHPLLLLQNQMMIQQCWFQVALILHLKKENQRKRPRCLPNSILIRQLNLSLKSKMSIKTFPLVNPKEWWRNNQTGNYISWINMIEYFRSPGTKSDSNFFYTAGEK